MKADDKAHLAGHFSRFSRESGAIAMSHCRDEAGRNVNELLSGLA